LAQIPDSHRDILVGQNFAHIATLGPDGAPQTSPVWVDVDGNDVLFNSAEGRQKVRNLDRDPRVALSVHDSGNPYRYIEIRGKVVEKTHEGADAHIDKMAQKYLGEDKYPWKSPNEQRVIYRIRPEHINTMG